MDNKTSRLASQDMQGNARLPVKGHMLPGSKKTRVRGERTAALRSQFSRWLYRGWLCLATGILMALLLRLQSTLDIVTLSMSPWQRGIQWAELVWLAPVPMAIALWVGWFVFVEAVKRPPTPIAVPYVGQKPVRLVFRFVTRGDNIDVLWDSVQAVHQAFVQYQHIHGPYRIEIVTEKAGAFAEEDDTCVHTYVVPQTYMTQEHSRFKARALTYIQEQVSAEVEDWYVYLDEESMVDETVLAGVYRFIRRTFQAPSSGWIGQGAILYQSGSWFFRGADALRTADDLGRFRLQYALGIPLFGVHGSYLVVRGSDDRHLSFDVGAANSITEDTAWALHAWSKGYRFSWVEGYVREQPPQNIMDFVKQRSRWLSGIRLVLGDTRIAFRYRAGLLLFIFLWQISFFPFTVALVTLFVHAAPFAWMRVPADFAWATFFLAYFQGLDVLAKNERPVMGQIVGERSYIGMFWKRICMCSLVLCCIWYSMLEAAAALYSLRAKQGFFVIQKPSFTSAQEKVIRQGVVPLAHPSHPSEVQVSVGEQLNTRRYEGKV